MQLYASLKLLPRSYEKAYVSKLLSLLGLELYADRCAGGLSGGNKRKLSVGISLIGGPSVVVIIIFGSSSDAQKMI